MGEQIEIQAKYAGYIERQNLHVQRLAQQEDVKLPEDLNYAEVIGLSNEAKQKLLEIRPVTIGQAARDFWNHSIRNFIAVGTFKIQSLHQGKAPDLS